MKYTDVTGLILAGGHSRRFGAEKARHLVEGQWMIGRVYEVLNTVADRLLISVREPAHLFDLPARHVVDRYPGAGPLAGLQAGLQAAETPWLLAVACDMPFLTPEVLHALLAARAPGVAAVAAQTPAGRRQPLCACYHHTTLPAVTRQLAEGHLAAQALLDALPNAVFVTLPDAPLRNVNTSAELTEGES